MHQDSKRSRQLFISSVGTKHMLSLLLSLLEKLFGSKGTSRDSHGCQTKGPSSWEIWICFEPLELTVSGPSLRLAMLGKVDMRFYYVFWFVCPLMNAQRDFVVLSLLLTSLKS